MKSKVRQEDVCRGDVLLYGAQTRVLRKNEEYLVMTERKKNQKRI